MDTSLDMPPVKLKQCNRHSISMSVASACACTICGEHTHTSRECTDLWSDLKKGFYSGGGANRDYGGDEDSEASHKGSVRSARVDTDFNNLRVGHSATL